MEKRTKIGLAIFLLVILFIPLKRNVFSFIKEKPLNGKYKLVEEPELETALIKHNGSVNRIRVRGNM